METVLVTGGAGFIGSNIVEALLQKGYSVRVLDNLSTGRKERLLEFIDKIELIEGDIRDMKTVEYSLKDIDYILHQAALPSVTRSVENPIETSDCNIKGTLNILDAARRANVKRIVYASSSSVYGNAEELPKKEKMQLKPLSPYAVTKISMEYYFDVFNNVYGIESIGLRYFNVYGPRQNPKSEYAAVIPRFINAILNDERPVIYGSGEQTRDFTFVGDVIQANLLAMNAKGISHEVFNTARGEAISINKLLEKINSLLGKNIEPVYTKPREGDIMYSLADISKAKERLGYKPEYNIEDGLRETIKYFREKHD